MHRPSAENLLLTARTTLLEELLPALPPQHHYAARMVASAMAMAARECAAAPPGLEKFRALYGDSTAADQAALERRLARDLRDGAFGPETEVAVRALLLELVAARLRVSNPKHLQAAGPA